MLRGETNVDKKSRLLWPIEEGLSGAAEVLSMRTTHFQTALSKGQSQVNQIADLADTRVQFKRHQVPSEAYVNVYAELSAKYVIETTKCLAKGATGSSKKRGAKE